MSIKQELQQLKKTDIWSLMLFVLYNFQQIPEYSSISELAYVLDEKNMLKLCEYFGGQTIKIPTIDELENTLYAMLLYQYVDIEHMPIEDGLMILKVDKVKLNDVKACYKELQKTLSTYSFVPRNSL